MVFLVMVFLVMVLLITVFTMAVFKMAVFMRAAFMITIVIRSADLPGHCLLAWIPLFFVHVVFLNEKTVWSYFLIDELNTRYPHDFWRGLLNFRRRWIHRPPWHRSLRPSFPARRRLHTWQKRWWDYLPVEAQEHYCFATTAYNHRRSPKFRRPYRFYC